MAKWPGSQYEKTLILILGILTAFGLGFFYFIGAIPGGVAAHSPLWVSALAAWFGYSLGGTIILAGGVPLRSWITTKTKIDLRPDPNKLFWRIWAKFGLWGLCLIAPVTVGPQATALLALSLGESPRRIQIAISLGIIPWVILSALLTSVGTHTLKQ